MMTLIRRELLDNLMTFRFAAAVFIIGLCISAMTRRTSTALMLCMFVWGCLVLVYPNLILTAVEITPKPDAKISVYNQIKQMWEEYGPGNSYKKPSPLHFCANRGEPLLPDAVEVDEPPVFMTDAEGNRLLEGIWNLSYPDANLQNKNVGPNVSQKVFRCSPFG